MKRLLITEEDRRHIMSLYHLVEERRYIGEDIETQISKFIGKYKGKEDKIFVSFRSSIYVTMINRNNTFGTPTGIYTYPWKGYFDKLYEQKIKGGKIVNIISLVPFEGSQESKFIYIYKIKDNATILSNDTKYEELRKIAERIEPLYPNNIFLSKYLKSEDDYLKYSKNPFLGGHVCETCHGEKIECYDCGGDGYVDGEECETCYGSGIEECEDCFGSGYDTIIKQIPVRVFWVLLYDIVGTTGGNPQLKFTNLCNKIGIDGFVDYGDGYIHPNERTQAVLLKGRSIIEDYTIISSDSGMDVISLSTKILDMDKNEFVNLLRFKFHDRFKGTLKTEFLGNFIKHLRKEKKIEQFLTKLIKEFEIHNTYYSTIIDSIKYFLTETELKFLQELQSQNIIE